MRRGVRIALQLGLSAGILAYLVWQIDVGRTVDLVASSRPLYVLAALAIFIATVWPLAWRWQVLLASKGIREPLGWLTKTYFVSYAASQVLPAAIGGDAVRIFEHARRRPNKKGEAAAAVLMERVAGSVGILLLVTLGLALAVGRYDNIRLLAQIELACVGAVVLLGLLLFSVKANTFLQERVFPRGAAFRLHGPFTALWTALHGYRTQPAALALAIAISMGLQFVRTLAIWMCGEAVGLDLSPLVYIILGPLLFLVMMVPITVNGLGVRESFFVFFLARFGVDSDAAFAVGFLFFAISVAAAVPGGLILMWRSVRGGVPPPTRGEPARVDTP